MTLSSKMFNFKFAMLGCNKKIFKNTNQYKFTTTNYQYLVKLHDYNYNVFYLCLLLFNLSILKCFFKIIIYFVIIINLIILLGFPTAKYLPLFFNFTCIIKIRFI